MPLGLLAKATHSTITSTGLPSAATLVVVGVVQSPPMQQISHFLYLLSTNDVSCIISFMEALLSLNILW